MTLLRVVLCSILFAAASIAQSPNEQSEPPRFEVAVIHPTNPKDFLGPSGCSNSGAAGLVSCTDVTLKRCIVGAHRVLPDQVLGGPDWIDVDRFQITGKADQALGEKGLMAMLQTLLAAGSNL